MDALGVLIIGAGGWLVYSAYKGEHPWSLFGQVLQGSKPSVAASIVNPSGVTPQAAANQVGNGVTPSTTVPGGIDTGNGYSY